MSPMLRSDPALLVEGLEVRHRMRLVLEGVDVRVPRADLTAIVGPNGAGKSTFLKAVLGIVPAKGRVELLGRDIEHARAMVAYVPQRESVDFEFPVTALDVVLMGLYRSIGWLRRIRESHRHQARVALEEVGLADRAHTPLGHLSGGQQQRVFLARALAQAPELFLLDEALAGVDAATEEHFFTTFERLQRAGKTVVMVHHDLGTVADRFDRLIVLGGRAAVCGPTCEVLRSGAIEEAYGSRSLGPRGDGLVTRAQTRSATAVLSESFGPHA